VSKEVKNTTSRVVQFIVELSRSNIRMGETHGACNQYRNTNPSSAVNPIYFMFEPRFGYYSFFRFLPLVRTYYRILGAIEKLKIKSLDVKDLETMKAMGETILTKENEGFKDILALLKKNQYISNEDIVTELRYWESYYVRKPPPFGLHLKCLNATVNGKDKFLLGAFDALYQLKEMADVHVRGKITAFIVICAFLISLLSVFLVVYTNL
jgi:hypothetical protein